MYFTIINIQLIYQYTIYNGKVYVYLSNLTTLQYSAGCLPSPKTRSDQFVFKSRWHSSES